MSGFIFLDQEPLEISMGNTYQSCGVAEAGENILAFFEFVDGTEPMDDGTFELVDAS